MKTHPLPHFNERPEGTVVDTLVIHSIYAPNSPDIFHPSMCIALLDENKVASHYLIDREGDIVSLVDIRHRAWHAGPSKMPFTDDNREEVNDFSIGIELIGGETTGFTDKQYDSLINLIAELKERHPLTTIIGHDTIAPDRKIDPGPCFEWNRLKNIFSNMRFK